MNAKTQERGHCPCCGREWAVIDGHMSKHGYTVEQGWFNGVCSGNKYGPIEHDRKIADDVVKSVNRDVKQMYALAEQFEQGIKHPDMVRRGHTTNAVMVPWNQAEDMWRRREVERQIWTLRGRASQGESFAQFLASVIAMYHGKPLNVVELAPAPEAIRIGEKRRSGSGLILTVARLDRARVIYTFRRAEDDKLRQSWVGVQAWRKMEKVS